MLNPIPLFEKKELTSSESLPVFAAFDFDGTISTKDILVPFLMFTFGPAVTFKQIGYLLPQFILFVIGLKSRKDIKELILTNFFKGFSLLQFNQFASLFTKNHLEKLIKPEAIERILWHKRQGHTLLLISANIEPLLSIWAKQQGFNGLLASKLHLTTENKITGKVEGENCWGEEKVHRLLKWINLPKSAFILYAYGDSKGDEPLLKIADFPYYRKLK